MIPRKCRVYTPRDLADAMVSALGIEKGKAWLEPSFGGGVFIEALAASNVDAADIVALELDSISRPHIERIATCFKKTDAMRWLRVTDRRFDAIVGNPPYASISDLSGRLKESALQVQSPITQTTSRASSNLWLVFLLSALNVLKRGGGMCFVLPAAWDFADYAAEIRESLPTEFESFAVFRSAKPLFDNVLDGCVVILAKGYKEKNRYVARVECADSNELCAALRTFCLSPHASAPKPIVRFANNATSKRLGDFIDLSLGGVTGHSEYFVLNERRRLELELPLSSVTPVLTKARHLSKPIVDRAAWKMLRDRNEPVWLFRPTDKALHDKNVIRYLRLPIKKGGCERTRYKISVRNEWYVTPLPRQVHGFISGMSVSGPRIVLSRFVSLSATNTLYVVRFKDQLSAGERLAVAMSLFDKEVCSQVLAAQRRYAGGLAKLEPSDILNLRITEPVGPAPTETDYARAFVQSLIVD